MDRINKSSLDTHKKQIGEAEREIANLRNKFGDKIENAEEIAKDARKNCHSNIGDAIRKYDLGVDKRFMDIEIKLKTGRDPVGGSKF